MDYILNSQQLWENFDPTAEQLDIDVIKQTERKGLVTKSFYFTGRELKRGKTRIYATVCYEHTACDKRAILLIGDYSKPIEVDVLTDLAKRGFVAMSVDLSGRRDHGLHTIYPFELDYCNHASRVSMFNLGETARDNKVYEYAVCARRAITYLKQEEKVGDVSVVTSGRGVYVGIIVMGIDDRISNGVVLFGNLSRDYPPPNKDEDIVGDDKDELDRHIAYDMRRQMWTLGLAPQTYALQIKVPLYVVNSANSQYVDILPTNNTFLRVNGNSRMLVLPTAMDYLPTQYVDGVLQWINGCVAPAKSELKSFTDANGDYCLRVITSHPFDKTSVWYCTDSDGRAKHWAKAKLTESDNGYIAKLNLFEKNCNVVSFAVFDGEISVSTTLLSEKITANNVKKANNIVFSGTGSQMLIPVCEDGAWWNVALEPRLKKGYLKIPGAVGKSLATFAVNDKSIRISPSFTVGFDICCKFKQTIKLTAVCKFGTVNESYVHTQEVVGNGKWERVTFDKSNFHRIGDGKQLVETEKVEMLVISADKEFIVNNIFLV